MDSDPENQASPVKTLTFLTEGEMCMCMLNHFHHVQLCNPMDCSPQGSSVHGILQASAAGCHALLQGIFQTQDGAHMSHVSYLGRWVVCHEHHLRSEAEMADSKTSSQRI